MPYPHTNFPTLEQRHLRDARLFATRLDLIPTLKQAQGGVIAEVGVARGDFSAFLIDQLRPRRFVAFDLFRLHELPSVWGIPTTELFEGKDHLRFYEQRFAKSSTDVVVEEGPSHVNLAKYGDGTFDLIYVDAGHEYAEVKQDADIAKRKVKEGGVLIFNDYIMFDHFTGVPYGVVPVVNELVVEQGWHVIGFTLQQHMFCDIALQR